jgi:hypothetical protein
MYKNKNKFDIDFTSGDCTYLLHVDRVKDLLLSFCKEICSKFRKFCDFCDLIEVYW